MMLIYNVLDAKAINMVSKSMKNSPSKMMAFCHDDNSKSCRGYFLKELLLSQIKKFTAVKPCRKIKSKKCHVCKSYKEPPNPILLRVIIQENSTPFNSETVVLPPVHVPIINTEIDNANTWYVEMRSQIIDRH